MKSQKEFRPALRIIGEKIYHSRVLKNMTTKQVAATVSLSPVAYRNIEKGESDPSITTILLIAHVLDIKSYDLIKDL